MKNKKSTPRSSKPDFANLDSRVRKVKHFRSWLLVKSEDDGDFEPLASFRERKTAISEGKKFSKYFSHIGVKMSVFVFPLEVPRYYFQ